MNMHEIQAEPTNRSLVRSTANSWHIVVVFFYLVSDKVFGLRKIVAVFSQFFNGAFSLVQHRKVTLKAATLKLQRLSWLGTKTRSWRTYIKPTVCRLLVIDTTPTATAGEVHLPADRSFTSCQSDKLKFLSQHGTDKLSAVGEKHRMFGKKWALKVSLSFFSCMRRNCV